MNKTKIKTLCDSKINRILADKKLVRELFAQPRFVCQNCGRAVSKKKYICKPTALPKAD